MSKQIQISGKNLGALAMPDFCPRCFWLDMHLKPPAGPFPSIFSSIDSYTKRAVQGWFDAHGSMPAWLSELNSVVGYKPAPHWSRFFIEDQATNIKLTGSPDGIYVCRDGSHLIVDYKTAKYTANADTLMPIYEVQLNAYGLIGEQRGLSPVSGLVLIYMEPVTDEFTAIADNNVREAGFAMEFRANIHPLTINPGVVTPLLHRVRAIYDLPTAPLGLADCENCQYTNDLVAMVVSM